MKTRRLALANRMARGLAPDVPLEELKGRYRRAQRRCEECGFDAVLIYGAPSEPSWIRYLANYVHPFVIADSFLVIAPGRAPTLLVDREWFLEQAKEMSWVVDVRAFPYVEFDWGYAQIVRLMRDLFGLYSDGTLGICEVDMPTKYYRAIAEALPRAKLRDATAMLWDVLAEKSPYDIEMIRKTAKIADRAMKAALAACGPEVPEYEVGMAAERVAWESGCECEGGSQTRSRVIVGSGSTVVSNVRPYPFTHKRLKKGEMFFIDLSLCFQGYYIDFCRTVCIGSPTQRQRDVYEAVMEMFNEIYPAMRPGITGERLWDMGLEVARRTGFEKEINFVWLGHGTGLTLSEYPFFTRGENRALKANTFANLEPGIFPRGKVGTCSVEDTLFIGEQRTDLVTTCPRELHIT